MIYTKNTHRTHVHTEIKENYVRLSNKTKVIGNFNTDTNQKETNKKH